MSTRPKRNRGQQAGTKATGIAIAVTKRWQTIAARLLLLRLRPIYDATAFVNINTG
jgi:hypothetical protein